MDSRVNEILDKAIADRSFPGAVVKWKKVVERSIW